MIIIHPSIYYRWFIANIMNDSAYYFLDIHPATRSMHSAQGPGRAALSSWNTFPQSHDRILHKLDMSTTTHQMKSDVVIKSIRKHRRHDKGCQASDSNNPIGATLWYTHCSTLLNCTSFLYAIELLTASCITCWCKAIWRLEERKGGRVRELEFHDKKCYARELCSHNCERGPRWCY